VFGKPEAPPVGFCSEHRSHFCVCIRPDFYKPPFTRTDQTKEARARWDAHASLGQTPKAPPRTRRRRPGSSQGSLWDEGDKEETR
jgi:hypothetical protein